MKYAKTETIDDGKGGVSKLIFADIIAGYVDEKYSKDGSYDFSAIDKEDRSVLYYNGLGYVPVQQA